MSDYLARRYRMDQNGNFESAKELERAVENGDLVETEHGYYDKDSRTEFYEDGEVRED